MQEPLSHRTCVFVWLRVCVCCLILALILVVVAEQVCSQYKQLLKHVSTVKATPHHDCGVRYRACSWSTAPLPPR